MVLRVLIGKEQVSASGLERLLSRNGDARSYSIFSDRASEADGQECEAEVGVSSKHLEDFELGCDDAAVSADQEAGTCVQGLGDHDQLGLAGM